MANKFRLRCNPYSEYCNFSRGEESMKVIFVRHGQTDWNKKKRSRDRLILL